MTAILKIKVTSVPGKLLEISAVTYSNNKTKPAEVELVKAISDVIESIIDAAKKEGVKV